MQEKQIKQHHANCAHFSVSPFQLTPANKSTPDACWPRAQRRNASSSSSTRDRRNPPSDAGRSRNGSCSTLAAAPACRVCSRDSPHRVCPHSSRLSQHVAVLILPHLGTGVVIGVGGNRRLSPTCECRRPATRRDAVHPPLVYGFVTLEKKEKKKEEAGRVFLSPAATVSLPRKRKLGVHFLSTLPPAALWEERQQQPWLNLLMRTT